MRIMVVPCAFDNYAFLIVCEETRMAAVIDPSEAWPVWQALEEVKAQLTAVLCTHHHPDHVGGIEDLLDEQPELQVYGHHGDSARIPRFTSPLDDSDELVIGRITGRALYTPGHTKGSLCYQFEDCLFTGDTLFGGGCGRLFEGTSQQMHDSLNNVIATLPDETRIFFGHEYTAKNLEFARRIEPSNEAVRDRLNRLKEGQGASSSPTTLLLEKATNPFLRCHLQSLRVSLLHMKMNASNSEVFSIIRQMRDRF